MSPKIRNLHKSSTTILKGRIEKGGNQDERENPIRENRVKRCHGTRGSDPRGGYKSPQAQLEYSIYASKNFVNPTRDDTAIPRYVA